MSNSNSATVEKIRIGEFGFGGWSQVKKEAYNHLSYYFQYPEVKCHAVAEQIAKEAGRVCQEIKSLKVSAAKGKDMTRSLKPVMETVKKQQSTIALSLAHMCLSLDELHKQGLQILSVEVPKEWHVKMDEWADSLQERLDKQNVTSSELAPVA